LLKARRTSCPFFALHSPSGGVGKSPNGTNVGIISRSYESTTGGTARERGTESKSIVRTVVTLLEKFRISYTISTGRILAIGSAKISCGVGISKKTKIAVFVVFNETISTNVGMNIRDENWLALTEALYWAEVVFNIFCQIGELNLGKCLDRGENYPLNIGITRWIGL
jgi:hypothetical protein